MKKTNKRVINITRRQIQEAVLKTAKRLVREGLYDDSTDDEEFEDEELEDEEEGEEFDDSNKDQYWETLVENGIATEEELQLVTDINGYSVETLDDVLYARTGYRSWSQYSSEY